MIRRPPRSTRKESSAASDVYKRQNRYNSRPMLLSRRCRGFYCEFSVSVSCLHIDVTGATIGRCCKIDVTRRFWQAVNSLICPSHRTSSYDTCICSHLGGPVLLENVRCFHVCLTGATTKQMLRFRRRADNSLQVLCIHCLLYTSPSPRDGLLSRMPSSA